MTELDALLSAPELPQDRVDRIRRRGKHRLAHPHAAGTGQAEVLLVSVFSVAMLVWAVAQVIVPAV